MNQLNELLIQIEQSQSDKQEHQSFQELSQFIGNNSVSINVYSISDGAKTSLQDVQELSRITEADIVFTHDDQTKRFTWTPQDINNVFILFQE